MQKRIFSLDGLRGFAVILVVLFHLNREIGFSKSLGSFGQFFSKFVFGGGQVGVDLFFLLSGFLIAFLYPQIDDFWGYISKRWARIFPVFWASVIFAFFGFMISDQKLLGGGTALLLIIVIGKIFSSFFIKNYKGKIFWVFISIQLLMVFLGVFYSLFWSQGLETFSGTSKNILYIFSNMTLTVPFFSKLGYIDGAFWTLQNEVLFYLFYPPVILPAFKFIEKIKIKFKYPIFILGIILFANLTHLFNQNILSLGLISLYRVPALFVGAAIGFNFNSLSQKLTQTIIFVKRFPSHFSEKYTKILFNYAKFLLLLIIPFIVYIDSSKLFHENLILEYYLRNILLLPLALVLLLTLRKGNLLEEIFAHPSLLFFGNISYSLYLTHNSVIKVVLNSLRLESYFEKVMVGCLAISLSIGVAWLFNVVFERLYFDNKAKYKVSLFDAPKNARYIYVFLFSFMRRLILFFTKRFVIFTVVLSSLYLGITIWKYDNSLSIISQMAKGDEILTIQEERGKNIQTGEKIGGRFVSKFENLGILTLMLEYIDEDQENHNAGESENKYIFKLKQEGASEWLVQSEKSLNAISGWYPIGFPVIKNSKNQAYIWELSVEGDAKSQVLRLQDKLNILKFSYQIDKGKLMYDFYYLKSVLMAKIDFSLTNPKLFMTALVASLPFLYILIINKKYHFKNFNTTHFLR